MTSRNIATRFSVAAVAYATGIASLAVFCATFIH